MTSPSPIIKKYPVGIKPFESKKLPAKFDRHFPWQFVRSFGKLPNSLLGKTIKLRNGLYSIEITGIDSGGLEFTIETTIERIVVNGENESTRENLKASIDFDGIKISFPAGCCFWNTVEERTFNPNTPLSNYQWTHKESVPNINPRVGGVITTSYQIEFLELPAITRAVLETVRNTAAKNRKKPPIGVEPTTY